MQDKHMSINLFAKLSYAFVQSDLSGIMRCDHTDKCYEIFKKNLLKWSMVAKNNNKKKQIEIILLFRKYIEVL